MGKDFRGVVDLRNSYARILQRARKVLEGYCNVCPVCDGLHCVKRLPGMGGAGMGESFKSNVFSLRKISLKPRYIHSVKRPKIECLLFGYKFRMPIFSAPLTGVLENMGGFLDEYSFSHSVVKGCVEAGTLAFTGDGDTRDKFLGGVKAISDIGDSKGVVILKPREQDMLKKQIEIVEESGAIGVGIDIDSVGLINMLSVGEGVEPKTPQQIEELVNYTELPFILKGIMCVEDAVIASQLGVSAIVVSNHGGRISPVHPPVAHVLPAISEHVQGGMFILADGGVRTGYDVFKYIALGANAVLVGRPLIHAVAGGRDAGVRIFFDLLAVELSMAMIFCGCEDISNINRDCLMPFS